MSAACGFANQQAPIKELPTKLKWALGILAGIVGVMLLFLLVLLVFGKRVN